MKIKMIENRTVRTQRGITNISITSRAFFFRMIKVSINFVNGLRMTISVPSLPLQDRLNAKLIELFMA